jgi:hypothetical protein
MSRARGLLDGRAEGKEKKRKKKKREEEKAMDGAN